MSADPARVPNDNGSRQAGRQAPGRLDEGHRIVSFGVFQSNFLHIRLIEALFPHLTGAVALSERCGLLQVGFACVFRPNDMHPT